MQCKIKTSEKKDIKNNFDILSRKEKTITRYTRIYVKNKWQG